MRQDELEKAVSSLKTQQAAMRRDLKTAFRRIEEQTRLTDTVHQLALSIRDLANKQEHIQQDVQRIRGDVDELKGKPGKRRGPGADQLRAAGRRRIFSGAAVLRGGMT